MKSQKYDAKDVRAQAHAILIAWGMTKLDVEITVEAMVDCDLRGIDSHGVSLLQLYDQWRVKGQFNLAAKEIIVSEGAAFANIDAQGGLGFPVSFRATRLACAKALQSGIAAVTVHNSRHFGAAGYYARIAADEGMISMVATSTKVVCVVPPGATHSILGTNPIAYAIPRKKEVPIVFDMATSTAAGNKARIHQLKGEPLPKGWIVDGEGVSVTDPDHAVRIVYQGAPGGLTPLGSTPLMGAYKGYGLALMVQFLSGTLAGGAFPGANKLDSLKGDNIGHFFLAINPAKFRDLVDFDTDVAEVDTTLRNSPSIDPNKPILLPGDLENKIAQKRHAEGIPLSSELVIKLKAIANAANVPFILNKH